MPTSDTIQYLQERNGKRQYLSGFSQDISEHFYTRIQENSTEFRQSWRNSAIGSRRRLLIEKRYLREKKGIPRK
jgi:hypothetical protein